MVENNPSPSKCPDLEGLAAFVDGELSGPQRDAVVAHLADCEDCYEIYTETLHVQKDLAPQVAIVESFEEKGEDAELAPVVVHPRSRAWMWMAGASLAAATLFAALGLAWFNQPAKILPVGELVTAIGLDTTSWDDTWHVLDWPIKRSGALTPESYTDPLDENRAAFRIGVRVVDLQTSLVLEDKNTAERMAQQINAQLSTMQIAASLAGPSYKSLRRDLDLQELHRKSLEGEEILDVIFENDPVFFELGKWTEASRLAILTKNSAYFSTWSFRRSLRRWKKTDFGPRVTQALLEIDQLAPAGISKKLEDALKKIIQAEGIR